MGDKNKEGGGDSKVDSKAAVKGSHEDIEDAAVLLREQQEDERGKWANKLEFILACIGYAVGLGNVWRYPWLVYEYGGGSFVLAYWIILLTIAYPTFLYELVIGQFSSRGPVHIWRSVLPGLEGIGYALFFVMCLASIYYNALFALSIFYAASSFTSPWGHCHSKWNSKYCFDIDSYTSCVGDSSNRWYAKAQCYDSNNLTLLIDSFQDCWANGREHYERGRNNDGSNWKCSFQFQFNFTKEGTPCSLVNDLMPTGRKMSKSDCSALFGQYSTMNECLNEERSLTKGLLPTDVKMDFKFRKGGVNEKMLNGSKLMTKIMQEGAFNLTQYFQNYCKKMQPRIDEFRCFKRIIDPDESYSSEEYYTVNVNTPGAITQFSWGIVVSWFIAWMFTGFSMIQGIKTIGKLVYVTATLPLIMILVLDVIAATLPGFHTGVRFYLTTEFCKLKNPTLWLRALSQICFSLGIGTGGLSNMASYNKFQNDIVRDSIIISLFNCLFSFVGGFGVFGVIGFMAHQVQTTVPLILRGSSTGVAFVVFAQATCTLPAGGAVGLFFYVTLCLLAIDSELAQVELLTTFIYDEFPSTRHRKWAVVMTICGVASLVGLPFVSRASMEAVDFVDSATYSYLVPIIAFFNIVAIMYIYGIRLFIADMAMMAGVNGCGCLPRNLNYYMFGTKLNIYLYITWGFVAPVGILVIMISEFSGITGLRTIAACLSTTVPGFLLLVGGLLVAIFHRKLRGRALFHPDNNWGPVRNADRQGERFPPLNPMDTITLSNRRRKELDRMIAKTQSADDLDDDIEGTKETKKSSDGDADKDAPVEQAGNDEGKAGGNDDKTSDSSKTDK